MIKNRSNRTLVITFLFTVIVIVLFSITKSNFNHIKERKTSKQLTTYELISEYQNQSLEDLIEKVIEVDGVLKEIKYTNDVYTLYLTDENNETYILCELQKDQFTKVSQLVVGEKIKIKGVLKGHLMDVILLNCIII